MAITPFTVDDNVIDVRMNQMINEVSLEIGQIATDSLVNVASNLSDLNDFRQNNKWCSVGGASLVLNVPSVETTFNNAAVYNFGQTSDVFQQFYYVPQAGKTFVRNYVDWNTVKWSAWKEIATTESYKLQASDMLNGWTFGIDVNDLPIIIKSGKLITINALLKAGVVSSNTPIFSIPERFLPSVIIRNNFYKTASLNYAEFAIIQGGLKIYNQSLATNDIVKISMSYSIE